ncbi:MAG: RNA chaperone Hfq [Candidatus Aminicenantes bacterium]|nr:RNA chaperone Hfq [Candidatus Aminicenantes bacterium]
MTRKLIKPDLNEIKKYQKKDSKKKPPPPYKTHAENYYYIKQMNNRTPMVVALIDGTEVKGRIEWYDGKCIKVKKADEDNLIIFKHYIKYMHKDPEFVDERHEKVEEKTEEKIEEKVEEPKAEKENEE